MLGNCRSVLQLAEYFCSIPREKHLMVAKLKGSIHSKLNCVKKLHENLN